MTRELFGTEDGLRLERSTKNNPHGFLAMARHQAEVRRKETAAAERESVGPGKHPVPCTSCSDIHELDPWDGDRSDLSDPLDNPDPLEDPDPLDNPDPLGDPDPLEDPDPQENPEPQEDPQEDPLSELSDDPQENEVPPPDMPQARRTRPRNARRSSMTPESEDDVRPLPKKRVHDSELDNQGKDAEAETRSRTTKRRKDAIAKSVTEAKATTAAKAKPKAKPVMCSIVWLNTTDASFCCSVNADCAILQNFVCCMQNKCQ